MKSKNNIRNRFNIKSMRHLLMLMIVSFSLITFVGCGSDGPASAGDPPMNDNDEDPMNEQGDNEVFMVGTSFSPSNLEVTVGTTVTWTNQSSVEHTVTSGIPGEDGEGDLFDSGFLSNSQTFSFTFSDAGEYDYFCIPHAPGMAGKVTVVED